MTVTATYDDTNGVVMLDVDDYSPLVEQITIERSTDGIVWTTVRGAIALDLSGGAVTGVSDYEYTPCVENTYRAQAIPMGLYLPGVAGSYASTPDNAALDITGDIRLEAEFTAITAWDHPTINFFLVGKFTSPNISYILWLRADGSGGRELRFNWSADGTTVLSLVPNVDIPDPGGRLAVRVDMDVNNGAAGRTATFYTAPSIDGPWTLYEAVTSGGVTSLFSGSAILEVGSASAGTDAQANIIVHAARVYNSAGTIVADPDFTTQDHHDTSFADDAGRTWTVNGTASIETTQEGTVTPTTTKAWIKSVTRPFLNRSIEMSCGTAMGAQPLELLANTGPVRRTTRNAVFPIINRTFPVAVTDLSLGREWRLGLRTWTAAEHHLIDMLFASGDVLLIQVPCSDCAETFESGYVTAFDPAYNRHRRYRNRVVWETNVTEVAPPGPDIAYREATWATVLDQFGSWEAVLAAVPSWAALLALLPNPSEVIVE